jgi:ATP-dependent helicase/DNAse subunit B
VENDWERESVVRLVKSNYVGLDGDWSELLPEGVERWARHVGILRGKEQWLERLERKKGVLTSRQGRTEGEDEISEDEGRLSEQKARDQAAEIGEVIAFVRELAEVLNILPLEGSTSEYARAMCEVVLRLGVRNAILDAAPSEILGRDLSSYTGFLEALGEMEEAEARRYALEEFSTRLRLVLDRVNAPMPTGTDGRIRVLDVFQARHEKYPVVFIGGMVEKVFPHHYDQDPLYSDSARRALAGQGVRLQERSAKDAEEMFLFYSAITRATDIMFFTYPATDARGKYRMRSFYLDEVLSVLGLAEPTKKLPYSEPVPKHEAVWNAPDLGQWLFNVLWARQNKHNQLEVACAAYNKVVERPQEPVRSSILSAFIEGRRQSRESQDEYDGVLAQRGVLESVADRFPQDFLFSPTALQDYGCCPFLYFAKRVLGLEPLEEPADEVTAIERGDLYHKILWRFYTELRDERGGETRFSDNERGAILERILRVAAKECDRFRRTVFAGSAGLWRLATRAIERNLERFVDHEIELAGKYPERRPEYFEICFGMELKPPYDSCSVTEPLVFDGVHLCGKIDRVNVGEDEGTCVVVDYKTGSAQTSWRQVAEGTSFQLPIYWLACEELLFRERGIECVEACFYRLCGDYAEAVKRLKRNSGERETALAQCREHVKRYADNIRTGNFPVMPTESCPGWCDYRDICRYERGRIERKSEAP